MTYANTDAARELAAQLARPFAHHAELATRLADAQAPLIRGNDRLWWGLHPDGLAAVYGEHKRVRQVGPTQAEQMLARAEVAPTGTVSGLTARQRAGLAALLRLRAAQRSKPNRTKA